MLFLNLGVCLTLLHYCMRTFWWWIDKTKYKVTKPSEVSEITWKILQWTIMEQPPSEQTTLSGLNPCGWKVLVSGLLFLKHLWIFLSLSFLEHIIVFCQIHISLIEHNAEYVAFQFNRLLRFPGCESPFFFNLFDSYYFACLHMYYLIHHNFQLNGSTHITFSDMTIFSSISELLWLRQVYSSKIFFQGSTHLKFIAMLLSNYTAMLLSNPFFINSAILFLWHWRLKGLSHILFSYLQHL